jgi:hypothetical protein
MASMGTEATSPTLSGGSQPDWDNLASNVACPLCEYSLRGLAEPRCPECGYRFTWAEVLDPDRRPHSYLFEHHPEKNIRSFCRTALGGLRPGRFWRTLRPTQRSSTRRLLLYGLVVVVIYLGLAETGISRFPVNLYYQIQGNKNDQAGLLWRLPASAGARIIREYGTLQNYAERLYPTRVNALLVVQAWTWFHVRQPGFAWLAWPLATFTCLLIFRVSMRRARVKVVHVLRCVVYSFDVLLWVTLAAMLMDLLEVVPDPYQILQVLRNGVEWVWLAIVVLVIYRLIMAYRLYLRFDHPAATVLATQVICLLGAIVSLQFRLLYWDTLGTMWRRLLLWGVWD